MTSDGSEINSHGLTVTPKLVKTERTEQSPFYCLRSTHRVFSKTDASWFSVLLSDNTLNLLLGKIQCLYR